jgi:predicted dienelactone hydrolase
VAGTILIAIAAMTAKRRRWAVRPALLAILLCFAVPAQAAGFRFIDVPADAAGPALRGAVWYPCGAPPGEIAVGNLTLPGTRDCPVAGDRLPLVVISHGRLGDFTGHHDTAEALANAGFVVAALNHPGDTASDGNRSDDLSVFVERPTDIKRLIDCMLGASPVAARIDPARIGFFGFSRGGYTGLVAIGANPDWPHTVALCEGSPLHVCAQIRNKEYPKRSLTHDARIKAAVLADPLAIMFTPGSYAAIKIPVQLWQSARGGDGVTPDAVAAVDKALPVAHEYRVVPNSGHFAFLAPCPPGLAKSRPVVCKDAPGFDRAAFHKQFDADILAFFRAHLGADRH